MIELLTPQNMLIVWGIGFMLLCAVFGIGFYFTSMNLLTDDIGALLFGLAILFWPLAIVYGIVGIIYCFIRGTILGK